MVERLCQRCGDVFPSRRGTNRYCVPCGPLATRANEAAYRKDHKEARRLYEARRRRKGQSAKATTLVRCWCGNLFVPRSRIHQHCTAECGQRARRAKLKPYLSVVVAPAPALPPVDYNLILTEILETARRARATIKAETELAGQAQINKQERLGRVLGGLRNPLAVP